MPAAIENGISGELLLPARPAELGVARDYALRTAAAFGFDEDECDELAFAVNEAVTNAIRHGAPNERGLISIEAIAQGQSLTFSVRDYGTFRRAAGPASPLAEGGRGFAMMARCTDAMQLCVGQGITTVRLSKARS